MQEIFRDFYRAVEFSLQQAILNGELCVIQV